MNSLRAYQPLQYSANAMKKLGARLADEAVLTREEQHLYEAFIEDAQSRVIEVQSLLEDSRRQIATVVPRAENFEIAGRTKTRRTLADKLRRTPTEKLPSIHDVAGVRLVAEITLLEQDILAELVCELFAQHALCSRAPLVIDRRESPSYGYRAIHIVVYLSGRPVEIQLRTGWQHNWAQIMELLGDRWGREPRYGLAVVHPNEEEARRRQSVIETLIELSGLLGSYETTARLTGLPSLDPKVAGGRLDMPSQTLSELITNAEALAPELERRTAEARSVFAELISLISAQPHLEGAYSDISEGQP